MSRQTRALRRGRGSCFSAVGHVRRALGIFAAAGLWLRRRRPLAPEALRPLPAAGLWLRRQRRLAPEASRPLAAEGSPLVSEAGVASGFRGVAASGWRGVGTSGRGGVGSGLATRVSGRGGVEAGLAAAGLWLRKRPAWFSRGACLDAEAVGRLVQGVGPWLQRHRVLVRRRRRPRLRGGGLLASSAASHFRGFASLAWS